MRFAIRRVEDVSQWIVQFDSSKPPELRLKQYQVTLATVGDFDAMELQEMFATGVVVELVPVTSPSDAAPEHDGQTEAHI